ncbi:MAG: xanthine dehydrogenase family protein subunit M [Spirochaetales bacterium]|nr:xanthine dehydrogenase family protein subunit M [Spirochaetales bacterium]
MEYHVPGTLEEALERLSSYLASGRPAMYVAGGTDLAVQIAEHALEPAALVDLAAIQSLRGIESGEGALRIGAAVTIAELAQARELPRCLVQGARSIGSPQIRALATIGGNICNASPCGDTLAPLVVLGARFVLQSLRGEREVEAESFFTGPKATVRAGEEVLREIRIPEERLAGASAFRMIGKRNGQVISQVNVAVWLLSSGDGTVEDIRVAAGSVAPVPLRLPGTERLLRGRAISRELLERAETEVAREIRPISDVRTTEAYRRRVTASLFRDALEDALEEALGGGDKPRPTRKPGKGA